MPQPTALALLPEPTSQCGQAAGQRFDATNQRRELFELGVGHRPALQRSGAVRSRASAA